MSQVSRPMQIALLATALLAVVWLVALRPKPAGDGGSAATPAQQAPSAPGTEGLTRAVDKAHGAVDTANGDAQRAAASDADSTTSGTTSGGAGGTAASSTSSSTATAKSTTRTTTKAHGVGGRTSSDPDVRLVQTALRHHKAIAIAFVAVEISDAHAVAQELTHVSHFGGRAVALSVPISQLSRYGFITRGIDVTIAPTTLIIAPNHDATSIVGFADRFEIQQRLAEALAGKRS